MGNVFVDVPPDGELCIFQARVMRGDRLPLDATTKVEGVPMGRYLDEPTTLSLW